VKEVYVAYEVHRGRPSEASSNSGSSAVVHSASDATGRTGSNTTFFLVGGTLAYVLLLFLCHDGEMMVYLQRSDEQNCHKIAVNLRDVPSGGISRYACLCHIPALVPRSKPAKHLPHCMYNTDERRKSTLWNGTPNLRAVQTFRWLQVSVYCDIGRTLPYSFSDSEASELLRNKLAKKL
jgi:hypothetical protein